MICPNCENEYNDELGECPYCVDTQDKCSWCHKKLSNDSTKRYMGAICVLKLKKGVCLKDIKKENLNKIFDIITLTQITEEVYCSKDCSDNDMKTVFGQLEDEEGIEA